MAFLYCLFILIAYVLCLSLPTSLFVNGRDAVFCGLGTVLIEDVKYRRLCGLGAVAGTREDKKGDNFDLFT